MIFQKLLTTKSSVLNLLIKLTLLIIIGLPTALPGEKLKIGIEPEPEILNIENLNASGTNPNLSPSQQASPQTVEGSSFAPAPDPIDKIAQELPHSITLPNSTSTISSKPNASIGRVLAPPEPKTETLSGPGEKELVAIKDGEITIEALLSTYSPASMEVHLFDEDGSEIWFKGQSLLLWRRADDRSYAPLSFQGNTDPNSMYEKSSGDFSPRNNLNYKFDLKKGQKILLITSGQAEPSSFIKVSGNVF
ncbi:MAG: hypothetical protein ACQETH_00920 [Candidatus Rifleibacteriota bacterium]